MPGVTGLPSGLIALVKSVEPLAFGETALVVEPGTIGDAYADGVLKAEGEEGGEASAGSVSRVLLGRPARPLADRSTPRTSGRGSLSCDGGVDSRLHGLGVKPSLTPSMAAIWHHPLFGGAGFYPGTGGLELFSSTSRDGSRSNSASRSPAPPTAPSAFRAWSRGSPPATSAAWCSKLRRR